MNSPTHADRRRARHQAERARPGPACVGLAVVIASAVTLIAASAVAAQPTAAPAPPAAFGGMQINRDKPIQINATTLEVRDKEKKATFIGNVVVVQGDTTLKCKLLDVFYDQDSGDGKPPKGGPPQAGGQQQIRRLEAKGGVTVIQKEQTATGDTAIYELKTNSVTLTGNATVTQGQNIIRGDRIEVDLLTGVTQVKSRTEGESGVSGLLFPNAAKNANKTDADKTAPNKTDAAKDAPKTAPKQARKQPLKLN